MSRRFGGLVGKYRVANPITVAWKWYDQTNGVVEWTFTNPAGIVQSCALYRAGYTFGGAFWPVYLANAEFNTAWATAQTPLVDDGAANNSAPICVALPPGGTPTVVFVFTLAPGQSWSILEGGFTGTDPSQLGPIETVPLAPQTGQAGSWCVGYDPVQVTDWDVQTGTTLQGYSPNPETFSILPFAPPSGSPIAPVFNDPISQGTCSGPTGPGACLAQIEAGVAAGDLTEVLDGILCLLEQLGSDLGALVKRALQRHV